MGCDETNAKLREVRNEKLILNREAWKAVDRADKSELFTHLSTVGHLISWNFHLASPRAVFNDIVHQRFDHATLSFSLPAEEFSKKVQPARKPLAPTDRIDAVFLQNHRRAWQEQSKTRCSQPQRRMTAIHSWRCNGQIKR